MAEKPLASRTIVVTGGSSGLGRAIAVRLAGEGARVFVCGRSSAGLEETLKALVGAGGTGEARALDLAEPGALAAFIADAATRTGRLNGLINNAGVMHFGPLASDDPKTWREMIDVNLLALLEGSQAAIRAMRATKSEGHIVNISSLAGRAEALGVYGATKAAVDYIGRHLRKELERDPIRVTTIVPGGFTINLGRSFPPERLMAFAKELAKGGHDLGKPGRSRMMGLPDDIARAVSFVLTQPIDLNISEMVVRPAMDVTIPLD